MQTVKNGSVFEKVVSVNGEKEISDAGNFIVYKTPFYAQKIKIYRA